MPALTKERHFQVLRAALALAEERGSVSLAEAAAATGVMADELHQLLEPVLFLEFRTPDGVLVHEERAFLLTEDGYLVVASGNWLRDIAAEPPPPDVALRLLIAGLTVQTLATEPTPHLDDALKKLRGVVAVELQVPVERPACLTTVERAWYGGRSLRFRYRAESASAAHDQEALPHRVFCRWGHWYLLGRIPTETLVRAFRIDRMLSAELGDLEFDPPENVEIPEWFDLSAHEHTVRVRCTREAIDVLPQPMQVGAADELGAGRVAVDLTVSGDRRLEHLLVCLPVDADVLSPPEYRDLRRDHARQLLARLSA